LIQSAKKIPPGLARVRKELPRPGKIIATGKTLRRQRAKEQLRREIREILPEFY